MSRSSLDDLSVLPTDSDHDHDHGYQTDTTSPPPSDTHTDDPPCAPSDYPLHQFRQREYPQLDGRVYLDHAGTTLYSRSLIQAFSADLQTHLYGNPHSASSPSTTSTAHVDSVRAAALAFFHADPRHWDLVFVANATAAIRLVAHAFRDAVRPTNSRWWYGYHRDAHTSLVGVRECADQSRCFGGNDEVERWLDMGGIGGARARELALFAWPGQSNMTGRRLPLDWPRRIRKFHKSPTYTLLDAAALASTAPIDLSDHDAAPDFVALSFYKIFGFPNLGALLVRKASAAPLLTRGYFGGGTVDMVIAVQDTWHASKDASIHDRLEDGTLPFHAIFALGHALAVHERLYGPDPMAAISRHTARLTARLHAALVALRHPAPRATPLVRIYTDASSVPGDPSTHGATLAFNVLDPAGRPFAYHTVEAAADARRIHLRSGSLCNPGGLAVHLDWSPADMRAAYAHGHRCSRPTALVGGKATGVVRASLGAMSSVADVDALVAFLRDTYLGVDAPEDPDPVVVVANHVTAAPPCCSTAPRPRFHPADYITRHRPWDSHSPTPTSPTLSSDDEPHYIGVPTLPATMNTGLPAARPLGHSTSVRARRFGRSMVKMLRARPERGNERDGGDEGDVGGEGHCEGSHVA